MTLNLQSCQLWLSSLQTAMLTCHRNSYEFNAFTKPYPVKVGHSIRRKCNVWEKSWQKAVDSLPSEYITLPAIHRNIPMTSHNFHIRPRVDYYSGWKHDPSHFFWYNIKNKIIRRWLEEQSAQRKRDRHRTGGPFWAERPTWNIEACCSTNEADIQANENFGIECTMSEQASLSNATMLTRKRTKKSFN
jgi:hypothetical protein